MRAFMNGSALPFSDVDSSEPTAKVRTSKGDATNTSPKRVSTSSNGGRRSRSSLSGGDTTSLLSAAGLKKPNQKRVSGSAATVDGSQLSLKQTNIIQSVKKSLVKTKRQWDRTGVIHVIYVLVLLAYSFVGGALFKALDGPHADRMLNAHRNRCVEERERLWDQLAQYCANLSFAECENRTRHTLMLLDHCLRTAPQVPFNHSTSDYWNALIYAITVFTTIGYGNIVVMSQEGRLAMILYAMVGIPLFFAFLNDMGQWFHFKFLKIYDWIRRKWTSSRLCILILELKRRRKLRPGPSATNGTPVDAGGAKARQQDDDKDGSDSLIFAFAVCVLIFYLVVVCGFLVVLVRGQWSFFQAFYFLFQSISLIGFGDEFPEDPNIVLINISFIIIGIILLSMCFFILQEWIRGKTYRLSTQVRRSVRRWRHYAYRPGAHNILDRRRVERTRVSVALPHLGSPDQHWRRRTKKTDESVAGQRLAVVDDCSPGPSRRAVVAVLTFDEDDRDHEAAAVPRRGPRRRDGVHSMDETLITGQKWSSKRFVSLADGALEAEDAVFLKPESYSSASRRLDDRRRTVMCLDEISAAMLAERKRTPSWLKASAEQARRRKQKSDKLQKRLSFHDRPARFGKFQWIRQTHDEDEEECDDESDELEEDDVLVDAETATFTLGDREKREGSTCSDKDDYL